MIKSINTNITLYVVKIKYNYDEDYELFLNLEMALERFNYLKTIKYTSVIKKLEIKAIYGFITEDMVSKINSNDEETMKMIETEVESLINKGKLIAVYPRPKTLQEIVPYLTPRELSNITGMTMKACEKLAYEPIEFNSFSFEKMNKICSALNLSMYIFFK